MTEHDPHDHEPHGHVEAPWKHDGVRVIKGDSLDSNTPQTPGMFRQAAINHAASAPGNSGPAPYASIPTPRRASTITANWRA